MRSDKYYLICISIMKLLKTFTIQSSHYNHGRKYDCDKRFQNFVLILIGQNMLIRT